MSAVPFYFVLRDYRGTRAVARPGKQLPQQVFATFQYALGAYSYLLPWGKRSNGEEWIKAIEAAHAPTERRTRVIEAIKQAMGVQP